MLFSCAPPQGLSLALLATFALMGLLGTLLAAGRRDLPLLLATALHAGAGALTIFAADLITLLVGWELLTLGAYAIIRQGGRGAKTAAFWYLAAQISAAALFFLAIVLHVGWAGSLRLEVLAPGAQPFMLAAVLIKSAMMPFHGWLLGSYTRASYLGSFVLSAYATKVGVYTASRTLSVTLFGLPLLGYIGAFMAVIAVVAALRQHSARRLLSYHIISQVGYMLAGVGLVGSTLGVEAGLFHSINHIIYKGLLFLVVAVAADYHGGDDLRRMGGLARKMPLLFVCAVVGAAAIVGVPLTSGYVSKELLKQSVDTLQMGLLTAASVGTALSFTKFIYLIFLRPPDSPENSIGRADQRERTDATMTGSTAALGVLSFLSIAIGVVPRAVPGAPQLSYYSLSSVLSAMGSAAAGLVLWFPLKGVLVRGFSHLEAEPPLRGYLQRAFLPLLAVLRGSYRIDPQRAVSITVLGAVLLSVILTLAL